MGLEEGEQGGEGLLGAGMEELEAEGFVEGVLFVLELEDCVVGLQHAAEGGCGHLAVFVVGLGLAVPDYFLEFLGQLFLGFYHPFGY